METDESISKKLADMVNRCQSEICTAVRSAQIQSVGIDLADITVFRGHYPREKHRALYHLLFTDDERAECEADAINTATRFAECFAAKEAVLKAYGSINVRLALPQIEVTNSGSRVRVVSRRGECLPNLAPNVRPIILKQLIVSQTDFEAVLCVGALAYLPEFQHR